MKQDRRGSWYLLTGIVLGVAVGLVYSWVISPVKYVDAPPYALRADFKDEYRALVAAAYLYNYDLIRAEDRLFQLKEDDPAQIIALQAQRALVDGHADAEVKALGLLAIALGKGGLPSIPNVPATLEPFDGTPPDENSPASPLLAIPSVNPNSTLSPQIDSTYSPAQSVPFVLQENKLVCNPDQSLPLIQVDIKDAAGQPVPGVELIVAWDGGEDNFFTGLKPELGLGYADFEMTPQVVYTLHFADGGQVVEDITAAECVTDDGTRYWGSWILTFIQP